MDHSTTQSTGVPPVDLGHITRVRVSDQVVDVLIDAIVEGRFPVGSTLPPERELAEQLGVNRGSLRQALARLEQLGLTRSEQGRGTAVLDPQIATDPVLLSRVVNHLGGGLLSELFEMRTEITRMVARMAAASATADDVARLQAAVDLVGSAADERDRQRNEMLWFRRLAAATHNRPLQALTTWVWRTYDELAGDLEAAFGADAGIEDDLQRITTAIGRHQAAAAERAMASYAERSGALMITMLRSGRRSP